MVFMVTTSIFAGSTFQLSALRHCLPGVHSPGHIEDRIDAFLAAFEDRLQGMSTAEYDEHRSALLSAKLMKVRMVLAILRCAEKPFSRYRRDF